MGKFKAAFMFVSPDCDPKEHIVRLSTPERLNGTAVGFKDYDQAVFVAKELADQGFEAIELCGGFGHIGVARVAEAVEGRAVAGVVRFDHHPGMGHKSGDEFFLTGD